MMRFRNVSRSGPREFRVIGQYPDVIVEHLDKPSVDLQNLLPAAALISQSALTERTQERRMSRQDAHITVLAGNSASVTCSSTNSRSGVATSSWNVSAMGYPFIFCALQHVFDRALHVERLLRKLVVLAFDDFLEAADRVCQLHVLALEAGELLGHVERLREEPLDLRRARHGQLVFVATVRRYPESR